MPAWLAAPVGWVVNLFSSAVCGVVKLIGYWFAFRSGVKRAQVNELEKDARIKDEQLEIAARPPEHRSDILDRMHRNDL